MSGATMSEAKVLKFETLWKNHPTIADDENPCHSTFTNQCAIRLGTALYRSGVKTIVGVETCWFKDHKNFGHYLRAEELAKALKKTYIPGVFKVKELEPKDFHKEINGKTGIIFFKDYWQRTYNGKKEAPENRSGDHIDLWNGSRLTAWWTWVRIHLRIGDFGTHSVSSDSDYEKSKEIWFWQVL